MKIQMIDAPKQAQIYWLRQSEAKDNQIMQFLRNDLSLQKEQGILPVIVESGGGELEESLYLLIKRNAVPDRTEMEKAS